MCVYVLLERVYFRKERNRAHVLKDYGRLRRASPSFWTLKWVVLLFSSCLLNLLCVSLTLFPLALFSSPFIFSKLRQQNQTPTSSAISDRSFSCLTPLFSLSAQTLVACSIAPQASLRAVLNQHANVLPLLFLLLLLLVSRLQVLLPPSSLSQL